MVALERNKEFCERCYVGRSFTVENEVMDKVPEALIATSRIIIIANALRKHGVQLVPSLAYS